MSIKLMTSVWDSADLNGSDLLVLLALADWSNEEGMSWYSIRKIAQRARVSVRQAQRILTELEEKGYINRDERLRENGSHTSNIYQIVFKGGGDTYDTTPGDTHDTTPGDIAMSPPEPSLRTNKEEPKVYVFKSNICALYLTYIGKITPLMQETLIRADQEYQPDWFAKAFEIMKGNGKKSWVYAEGILKNWKESGEPREKRKTKADIERMRTTPEGRERYAQWEQ